jgi:histidyl-tRNA synthetase
MGPMFRYERPQKGRQRQFHQLGVEAFGVATPDQDAELIALCRQLWCRLGVDDALQLEINTIGSAADRARYREALVNYLSQRRGQLDEDSQRRLETNPLRILDSKDPDTQSVLDKAPLLQDYIDAEAQADFDQLLDYLSALNIPYAVNPRLVRGLDYYNRTVFEWTTGHLGAQSTVCGGGRYDTLVETFGGKADAGRGLRCRSGTTDLAHAARWILQSRPRRICMSSQQVRLLSDTVCQDWTRCVANTRSLTSFSIWVVVASKASSNALIKAEPLGHWFMVTQRWLRNR